MRSDIDYSVYLVTDRLLLQAAGRSSAEPLSTASELSELMAVSDLEYAVERAVIGGCTLVQLREKESSSLEFYECGCRIKRITDRYGVPLIINDRVDIALAVDAAGVHVGQSDLPAHVVRNLIGRDKILGVSASSFDEAAAAVSAGADYLGVGAMFATNTKKDTDISSMEELRRIRSGFELPIVVIGGINKSTIPLFKGIGIDGVAVVSAILGEPDIRAAAEEIREAFFCIKGCAGDD